MPTIWISGPYRFFFYSADCAEPPHVHVERDNKTAKFWINPVRLERSGKFARSEINKIQALVENNVALLMVKWNERCN